MNLTNEEFVKRMKAAGIPVTHKKLQGVAKKLSDEIKKKRENMIPKYNYEDKVTFKFNDEKITGSVYIIDRHGCFEYPDEVCYDIMATYKGNETLFKHIKESDICAS